MAVSLSDVVSFGRYEPLFRIASGGMAEVYAARIRGEAGFQKLVAVKRMHPHLASDSGFVDMFLNEARLAAFVASPYVVQTLDLGRGSDGSLYIVMELVVGLSLAALEDAGTTLPPEIAIELMAQAAQGLDDAHEATTPAGDPLGLIHRDVSPHNILVGIDGRARVTDFGIARAVHRPRAETNVRELKGKFAYMSPEQTRLGPLDRRSDVFSLGVVSWELLVGERLFAEREPTACITNVRKKKVPPPHEVSSRVPAGISKVVLKALDRNRDARHQNAGELSEDLRRLGREAFGRLPDRRRIAAFIKDAGGEELERLQRLIRLGTEGAGPEAMEAVRPGATRILAGEGSGVARIGSGAKRVTALIDEPGPKIPTVTLGTDDVIEELPIHGTSTVSLLESGDLSFEEENGPPTRDLRARAAPVAPPEVEDAVDSAETHAWDALSSEGAAIPKPDDATNQWRADASPVAAPSVSAAVRGSGERRPGEHTLRWLAIGVTTGVFLVIGILAALLLWPEEADRVPLPLEPTPAAAPEPERPRSVVDVPREAEAPVNAAPADPSPLPATEEPATEAEAESLQEEEPAETEAPVGRGRRAARRRSRRASRHAPRDAREGPVLLDVNAFDRHAQ